MVGPQQNGKVIVGGSESRDFVITFSRLHHASLSTNVCIPLQGTTII